MAMGRIRRWLGRANRCAMPSTTLPNTFRIPYGLGWPSTSPSACKISPSLLVAARGFTVANFVWVPRVAFVALPLMVQIINAKIMSRGVVNPRASTHRQQLHSLISLVKQCHPRLDGIDAVCVTIRRLTDLAQARFMSGSTSQIRECVDLIDHTPLEYLRLFLNLDLNLSNATMLDKIQFLELKEELLRTKKDTSAYDTRTATPKLEPKPASTQPTESSIAPVQQDIWDLNLLETKAFGADDPLLDIDELLGGDGTLGSDPSFIDLDSLPLMNQHMEWEMDAWLLGET